MAGRSSTPATGTSLLLLLGVAAVAGFATTLAYPPTRVPGMSLLGPAVGLWTFTCMGTAPRGAVCGLAWGLGFAGAMFQWAMELHLFAYLALAPAQAAFWMVIGAVSARTAQRRPGEWVVTVTVAWTLMEALRARWPLSGFEWGQLGLSAADLPALPAAAIAGTLGLTALSAALAAALVVLVTRRAWRPLAVVVVLAAAVTGLGSVPWTSSDGDLDLAVVQVDDPCPGEFAADCPRSRERLLARLVARTEDLDVDTELLLWGESTLRGEDLDGAAATVIDAMGELPAPLLAGTISPAGPGRYYNRNVLYDSDGTPLGAYTKREPVPFGEYVPWRDMLGGIAEVGRLVPTDMVSGQSTAPVDVPVGERTVPIGNVVSWEVTFARLVRDAAAGSSAVATLTTQASYGGEQPVSDQLLGTAQLRAAEVQKPVVVAATTGRSAVALPDGGLVGTTALFAGDTLTATMPLRRGTTPYALWGEWPVMGLSLVGAAMLAWSARRDSDPTT